MPLSNFDYEKIFREYEKKQMRTWHLLDERRREIYCLIPEYKILDEKIAELKRERRRLKYTDITGEGVFISDVFVTFGPREILGAARLYIPDTFIEMPKEVQRMKFPSVSRPQVILTSLDSSVNFAFSLVDIRTPDSQIGTLTLQMKETLKTANPAAVFYIEESELLDSGARSVCLILKILA